MRSAAFISDIHGNLEALRAVLADIEERDCDEIHCLGDIVGYGPDPAACVDLVRRTCRSAILGNHDEALVKGAWGFNPLARSAIDWTRRRLRPRPLFPGRRSRWRYLRGLPLTNELCEGRLLLVHGSPREPTTEYVLPRSVEFPGAVAFTDLFEHFPSVCLVGHTHIAGIFDETPAFTPQAEVDGPFRTDGGKYLINVGSVGQPRDQDWRACYLLRTPDGSFEFCRIEYPVDKTQQKIRAIRALDDRLADRLGAGL